MRNRRRLVIQLACSVALVAIAVGLVRLVERSDAAEVRYAAGLTCLYNRVFRQSGPVSIAIFGTSRTRWGIALTPLARGLKPPKLTEPILNAGRSFRGTDFMYQQLLDVAANHEITQGVIVEVALPPEPTFRAADSPYQYDYYRNFSGAVTLDRLMADLDSRPSEPIPWRVRDLGEQLRRRIDLNLEYLITGQDDANVPIPADRRPFGGAHGDCSGGNRTFRPASIRADEAATVPPGTSWSDQAPIVTDFDSPLWERELFYLRAFKAWGDAHDLPVIFTVLPRRVDPLVDPAVPRRFEELVGAPLHVPPKSLRDQVLADGYSDAFHFNDVGRAAYTAWLAAEIKPVINPG